MRAGAAIALVILFPVAALSQEQELKKAIAQCAAIDDIADRLDCFDSLARALRQMPVGRVPSPDPTPVESGAPGQWVVHVEKNPLDDTTTVVLTLNGSEREAQLLLRCMQRKPDVLLSWGRRFIGADGPVVWTRFGEAKAEKKRWSPSTDRKAVFWPGDPKLLIRQLLSVDRVVVQTEHFAKGTITDVFDVHGLNDAIGPLKEACRLD